MSEYKEGRGDYYLAAGKREERSEKERLTEAGTLRRQVLQLGGRLDGFGHTLIEESSKPSDPSDIRWDCLCGYAGSPKKIKRHWEMNLAEYEEARSADDPPQFSGLIATAQAAQKNGLTLHLATRATCQEHLAHGDDKRTEPFTAATFGLDSKRLERALNDMTEGEAPDLWWNVDEQVWYATTRVRTLAEKIAVAYVKVQT